MPRPRTGSFEQRKNGEWAVRVTYVDDNGKSTRKWVLLGEKNLLIAKKKAAPLLLASGAPPLERPETFEEAATRVFAARLRAHPATRSQEGLLRHHVHPFIGKMLPSELRKLDLVRVLERLAEGGRYSSETINHINGAINVVFTKLRQEGVLENPPRVPKDEVPEGRQTVGDKAALSDDELLCYLSWTPAARGYPRTTSRELQLMVLLSRAVGGMRTGEVLDLTWDRVDAEDDRFGYVDVRRHKTGGAQRYTLDAVPVLSKVLHFWHLREGRPDHGTPLFPVRRPKAMDRDRVGEKRGKTTFARMLRRDVERAFAAQHAVQDVRAPRPGGKRHRELLEGTEMLRSLCFHTMRNLAVEAALEAAQVQLAGEFSGHSNPAMVRHYAARLGRELKRVPVRSEHVPSQAGIEAVLRIWCAEDGVDPAAVGLSAVPENASLPNGEVVDVRPESPKARAIQIKPQRISLSHEPCHSAESLKVVHKRGLGEAPGARSSCKPEWCRCSARSCPSSSLPSRDRARRPWRSPWRARSAQR